MTFCGCGLIPPEIAESLQEVIQLNGSQTSSKATTTALEKINDDDDGGGSLCLLYRGVKIENERH